jgi:hypothetical protein
MPVPEYDSNLYNKARVEIYKDAYKGLPIIFNAGA